MRSTLFPDFRSLVFRRFTAAFVVGLLALGPTALAESIHRGPAPSPGHYGPSVVARVSLLNQSSSVGPATLWTPTEDGLFLALVYMVQTPPYPSACTGDLCGTVTPYFDWTDDVGTQSTENDAPPSMSFLDAPYCAHAPTTGCVDNNPNGTFVIRAKAGTPINYHIYYEFIPGASSNPTYNCFIVLEQVM